MKYASIETFWETATKTKMGTYLTTIEVEFFLKAINFSECNLVIDIGTGAGKFSLIAAQKNVEVIAIDIDSHGLKRLRLKNNLVNVVLADARYIPIKEDVFNAAFMMEVIDYIPELETVLTECQRTLKNGGSLVFSFGNSSSLKSKLRKIRRKYYMHSYPEVAYGLDKAGLKIVKKEGFNWLPFNRTSQNLFVPLFAKIEKLFGLRKIPSLSPWVLIHSVKPK
jgi:ubiquinone/menaquinone biosynthesis C-methylase UbiE